MDELLQLDESIFQEDESLTDRMRRQTPKFDMTNASLTAVCGNPPIPIHSQDDDASSEETVMFNILVTLIDIPDRDYVRSEYSESRGLNTDTKQRVEIPLLQQLHKQQTPSTTQYL
jgi:hypothetical protein